MNKFNGIANLSGRPKGAVNKTTAETKELLQKIISNELEGVSERLEQLDNKDRIDVLIKILPYIVPKQKEISIDLETKRNALEPLTINLIPQQND